MRKFICSLALICTVGGAAFLGACSKGSDSCCDKDKATVKTDSDTAPAAKGCTGSGGCSGKCTGDKKVCPVTGQSN